MEKSLEKIQKESENLSSSVQHILQKLQYQLIQMSEYNLMSMNSLQKSIEQWSETNHQTIETSKQFISAVDSLEWGCLNDLQRQIKQIKNQLDQIEASL